MTQGSDDTPKDDPQAPTSTLRSVGSTLGGWAKRVGKVISDVAGPQQPEEVTRALQQAQELRAAGNFAVAQERLQHPLRTRPNDPNLLLSQALTLIAYALVEPTRADLLHAFSQVLGKRSERSVVGPLVEATLQLLLRNFDASIDTLRRARKLVDDQGGALQGETKFTYHLLTTLAQAWRGRYDRALLELHKARARLPDTTRGSLRELLLSEGAQISLASDSIDDAIAWLTSEAAISLSSAPPVEPAPATAPTPAGAAPPDLIPPDQATLTARAYLALALAAKGDRIGSDAALAHVDAKDPHWDELRLRVGLCLGLPTTLELARQHLQRAPKDLRRRRLWALAEAAAWPTDGASIPDTDREACLAALLAAAQGAPPELQLRHLHELAHIALRSDLLGDDVVAAIRRPLADQTSTAPEELRLVNTRRRIHDRDDQAVQDFVPGPPLRFRSYTDLGGPGGPDEVSPLRDTSLRTSVLRAQRALAAAEFGLAQDITDSTQDHLVEVLTEFPNHTRARSLLMALVQPISSKRLEDLLTAATSLLAAIPGRLSGVPLTGVQDALTRVIAARERLARPLTIAVMGEFSSGKSTFINALLGEAVAPMGVLPTTSTINLFRRGPSGSARVHYRDGTISTVARDEVHTFLKNLDDLEASRIRHMEIERTGPRLGDAAVVDTPGLNALDTFHEQVTREFVEEADAVIWIFSATRGGAASEGTALKSLAADGRQVLGVLNKVDTLDDDERTELITYLREEFSGVILDVVPVCASAALTLRCEPEQAEAGATEDPFVAVETALEQHFFAHARELKRSLTARRLGDALDHARTVVLAGATALDARAAEAATIDASDPRQLELRLINFADTVYGQWLALDDLLTRECLALGILRAGTPPTRAFLATQDAMYLASTLRDGILRALQVALLELSDAPGSDALGDVLTVRLIPWTHGFLDSLESSGFVTNLVLEHGPAVAKGEAALREQFRIALQPVAARWQKFIRGLFRDLHHAHRQARHSAAAAPRAEALRLRTTTIASLDAIRLSLDHVAP